ncbi:MAG: Imm40 family immunity protein [Bacteroidales bacterium]|jgi:hypothetical protein|nr:Imm40 family immunity protein [Bacteroidales bacterium]
MTKWKAYFEFIKEKGNPLSKLNPGSNEYALEVEDAYRAIELLKEGQIPVLGGDILSNNSGSLIYAYQFWGSKYHSLNWYCEKENSETSENFCKRSYCIATEAIDKAKNIAKKLGEKCYIVLIV